MHEPFSGLGLDRANYLLSLTRDQIQVRAKTGLVSPDVLEFYRIRWCRLHGARRWGDVALGTMAATGRKPRIER